MASIIRTDNSSQDFLKLVRSLDEELKAVYGILQEQYTIYNKTDSIETVVVGYIDKLPVACGCFKTYDQRTIEIKRMFVKPKSRGSGVAKLVLLELEKWGIEEGFRASILETGIRQAAAIRFYTKLGYNRINNYAQYIGNPNSICFKKELIHKHQ